MPEELVRLLNPTALTDIVFKYDGLLVNYIGDAIMAVFSAPPPLGSGLGKYREGLWDEVIAAFRGVLEVTLGDYPAQLYIDCCEALKEPAPAGEWGGVFTMIKK